MRIFFSFASRWGTKDYYLFKICLFAISNAKRFSFNWLIFHLAVFNDAMDENLSPSCGSVKSETAEKIGKKKKGDEEQRKE